MQNPFRDSRPRYGQDPFVIKLHTGAKLLIQSDNERQITARDYDRPEAPKTLLWDHHSQFQVWAPELHYIDRHYYIYYTYSNGGNHTHRMYALKSISNNPLGPYQFAGSLGPDAWAIDMTIFRHGTQGRDLYAIWSGWEPHSPEFPQNLYIAPMYGPLNIGQPTLLAEPALDWENSVKPILEGPQQVPNNVEPSILYAANASWTQEYATGRLQLLGPDPLNPKHWKKSPHPLLQNGGHGCIVDQEYIYHTKLSTLHGWSDRVITSTPVSELFQHI